MRGTGLSHIDRAEADEELRKLDRRKGGRLSRQGELRDVGVLDIVVADSVRAALAIESSRGCGKARAMCRPGDVGAGTGNRDGVTEIILAAAEEGGVSKRV